MMRTMRIEPNFGHLHTRGSKARNMKREPYDMASGARCLVSTLGNNWMYERNDLSPKEKWVT
jgi:hypothetical protein